MSSDTISREDYFAASASGKRVSFHSLLDFARNPADYHLRTTGVIPQQPTTRDMFLGTAAHTLILQGAFAYEAEYTVADGPINAKTGKPYGTETKAYADWLATQTGQILSTAEDALIRGMDAACHAVDVRTGGPSCAAQLLAQGRAETVLRFDWCGLTCQSMVDWIVDDFGGCGPAIVDLKTCADISDFEWEARRRKYIHQLAFYRDALRAGELHDLDAPVSCYLVAIEKSARPRVGAYYIPDADLDEAQAWCETQLVNLFTCHKNGIWPTGYEGLRELTLRNYQA